MTLTSRSLMWVMMVQHKTSDQYLTSGKVSTSSIHRFKRYRLLKTLPKNFKILSNADADTMVTAIALPVLSYRRAKNNTQYTLNSLRHSKPLIQGAKWHKCCNDPKCLDRQVRANSVDPDQTDPLLRVYTVCHSDCIFWIFTVLTYFSR